MTTHTTSGFTDSLGSPTSPARRIDVLATSDDTGVAARRRWLIVAALGASGVALAAALGFGQPTVPAPPSRPDVLEQLVNQGLIPRQALDPVTAPTGRGPRTPRDVEITRRLMNEGLVPRPHRG